MKIALNSSSRKRLAIVAGSLLCLSYIFFATRIFAAFVFSERPELQSLQRAIRIDPRDASYRNRLGRYYALVARDPEASLGPYRAAVQLNPYSAGYWFDLASAYQVLGDRPNQTLALGRAIEADPTTPDVAWEAANFYLVQGESERALREFHVVLDNDPGLASRAIEFCWRINPDVDSLLRDVVPAKSTAYLAFLELLMKKKETNAATKVWAAMMQTADAFEIRYVFQYIKYLFENGDAEEAQNAWRQATGRFGLSSYMPTRNNLIVNGDFSLDVLNGGFDWEYEKQQGVNLTLDPSDFHGGHRSLLMAFDGPGLSDAGIHQFIVVHPGTSYRFSAYYKRGEIEGAGGLHFVIEDAYKQRVLYDSDELKETGFWKSAMGEFTVGDGCKLLVLRIRRFPEGRPIRGKLWVDDFRLTPKPMPVLD